MGEKILLTGATGFVGRNLFKALREDGAEVLCASRNPKAAAEKHPDRNWQGLDVSDATSLKLALRGCSAAYYLIHSMGMHNNTEDYESKEKRDATRFVEAAVETGVRRLVYLGGVTPTGTPSKHLRSRIQTGKALREGPIPVVELRAGMIVGPGSESWQIVRDLSMRLPLMLLPSWLDYKSEPVAINDVVAALVEARKIPEAECGCYSLPGPETLSGKEILERAARIRGLRPITLRVPFVTPILSSYWIRMVTRADFAVARELVQGMTSDLVAQAEAFWKFLPHLERTPFDRAARSALDLERATLPRRVRLFESVVQSFSRKTPRPSES